MLVDAGARVTVVTGMPPLPGAGRCPRGSKWRLRSHDPINGVDVIPRPSLRARPGEAWSAGCGGRPASSANAGLVHLPPPQPVVVVAASPSLSGPVVARRLARHAACPTASSSRTSWARPPATPGVQGAGRMSGAAASVEGGALRDAAGVAVVSEGFRTRVQAYQASTPTVPVISGTGPPLPAPSRPREEVRAQLGWADDACVALHAGNMGLKQDLGNVVEAARLLADRRDVVVVLMGDGNQRAALEAQGAGIPGLRFLAPVDGDLAPRRPARRRPAPGQRAQQRRRHVAAEQARVVSAPPAARCSPRSARRVCTRDAPRGAAVRIDAEDPQLLADTVLELHLDPRRRAGWGRPPGVRRSLPRSGLGVRVGPVLRHGAARPRPSPPPPGADLRRHSSAPDIALPWSRTTEGLPMELVDYLRRARRQWVWVVGFVVVLTALAVVYVMTTPKISCTRRPPRSSSAATSSGRAPPGQLRSALRVGGPVFDRIDTYATWADYPAVLQPVVTTLKLGTTADDLSKQVSASVVPSTVIIAVSATNSAQQAADIANATANSLVK